MILNRRKLLIGSASSLIASPAVARLSRGSAAVSGGAGLLFNFIFDANWVSSAPASYSTALTSAAAALSAAFPNTNVTLNIEVGYTFFEQNESGTTIPLSPVSSAGSDLAGGTGISYTAIRAGLAAIPSPTTNLTNLLANTPSGGIGQSIFNISSANMKVLGLFGFAGGPTSARDATLDGAIGASTGWATGKLVGMFLHELSHVMGRIAGEAPFSFSRFSAVGTRDFTGGGGAGIYFSLNNGTSNLATYDNTSDFGDFANSVTDPGSSEFDCFEPTRPTPRISLYRR